MTPPVDVREERDRRVALSPFHTTSLRQRLAGSTAVLVTLGLHAAAAVALALNPGLAKKATTWVEMTVAEVAEPPPEPAPEPEKPKEKAKAKRKAPKEVAVERTAEQPNPEAPPDAPPETKPLRRVQGLSANSFAPGAGTGFAVRAGNTTAVAADGKGLALEDAREFTTLPSSAVATPPKLTWQPPVLDVPKEAQDARIQGVVEVMLDVDGAGKAIHVRVLREVGYGTGDACRAAWARSTWKPGLHQGEPVTVTGIRKTCTVRIAG